jgi:hypothetical protein
MAKPIFIIFIPVEMTKEMDKIQEQLTNKLDDYHILSVTHEKPEIEFKAFYEKDFTEIKFTELRQICLKELHQ